MPEIGTAIARAKEISMSKYKARAIEAINITFRTIGAAAATINLPLTFNIPLISAAKEMKKI